MNRGTNKMKCISKLSLFIILSTIVIGCKTDEKTDSFNEKWQNKAETSKLALVDKEEAPKEELFEIEEEPKETLVEIEALVIEEKTNKTGLPDDLVTIKFFKQSLSSVIRSLAKLADINVIVDDSLGESITMEIKDVPWETIFLELLETHSLNYKFDGTILKVLTPVSIRKKLEAQHLLEQLNEAKSRVQKTEPLVVQIIKINHLDVEKTASMARNILEAATDEKDRFRGSVEIDKSNNVIVLNAVQYDIDKIVKLITGLDQPATQVLIEAQIVVTTKRIARQLGVQWGGLIKGNKTFLTSGANALGVLGGTLADGINPTSGQASNFPVLEPSNSSISGSAGGSLIDPNSGLRLGLAYADSNMILSAQLSALEGSGQAHILSSPTITTLDNIRAFIESGSEIPYQSNSENTGTTTQFKKAVLRLDVLPHVIDNTFIQLDVEASNDEPDRTIVNKDLEPAITTRRTKTTVLLKDGQTTIIAGLKKEYDNSAESGIPILMDLPFIGFMFRSDNKESEMTELLIFITPYIVSAETVSNSVQAPPHKKD